VNKDQKTYSTPTYQEWNNCPCETMPYEKMNQPGTYYFHGTGMLMRVPPEALSPGHSPVIPIVWRDECYVTRISNDPWLPISKARQICANQDWTVNF
jgi:hypothetical protein